VSEFERCSLRVAAAEALGAYRSCNMAELKRRLTERWAAHGACDSLPRVVNLIADHATGFNDLTLSPRRSLQNDWP